MENFEEIHKKLQSIVNECDTAVVLSIDIGGEASFVVMNEKANKMDALHKSSTFHCMAGLLSQRLVEYE